MTRVHNFSAGPAALPLSVLEEIKNELPEYGAVALQSAGLQT